MKLIFAGTPEFAVPSLRAAAANGEVVAVLTQPDRPAGRGRGLLASPVKQEALRLGIEVLQPETLKDGEIQNTLRAFDADLMIVVAYGLILPRKVLAIPRHGCWNVHASLLPRWRGAAPIQRAIEAGDDATGVYLMQMEAGLDTGPVLLPEAIQIGETQTGGQLHDQLAELGARVLGDGLQQLRNGALPTAQPQPTEGVTYAHKLDKAEAKLDWSQPAQLLARKVRAFNPWPVAEAQVGGERLRIHQAIEVDIPPGTLPGKIFDANKQGIIIACGENALCLQRVQREGGKIISAADYLNARRDLLGVE
jgi:methionyl-tRNA formyltransferase